ncbi:hypothetical protein [Luteipulveratus mongoliensis]|uniref:Uncharacterized protein n=1 Tax=Luteipulveratus mongoliensis TaxID=571913 RepID=A0A0K1JGS0_9MICO|nr:hypothetical protein [Luteipulveratus mongoliensis]AKU15778.1 hypothetical protein VV02_07785 [Luteipulveratus mongoliensis]
MTRTEAPQLILAQSTGARLVTYAGRDIWRSDLDAAARRYAGGVYEGTCDVAGFLLDESQVLDLLGHLNRLQAEHGTYLSEMDADDECAACACSVSGACDDHPDATCRRCDADLFGRPCDDHATYDDHYEGTPA